MVTAITESLQAGPERPPRPIWLPVLGDPTPVDELVARWRGRPWHVDYGNNPGLFMPVALADYPRGARQEPYCLDLLRDNALVVGAPNSGGHHCGDDDGDVGGAAVSPGAGAVLLHRGQRPAAGACGGSSARGGVGGRHGREGVNRVIATVEAIVNERDRAFTTQRLDMDQVRVAKFGASQYAGAGTRLPT